MNYQYNPEDGGSSTDIVIDKIGSCKGAKLFASL